MRGVLKTFGRILPKGLRSQFGGRVRYAVAAVDTLEPILKALEATMAQVREYDRAVVRRARTDDTVRHLMSAPGVGPVLSRLHELDQRIQSVIPSSH